MKINVIINLKKIIFLFLLIFPNKLYASFFEDLTSQIVEVLCIVFTFFIISFFARYVWRSLTRNFERGTVSPTLTETPIWMVETVFFIGLTIFLFQMLVTALVVIIRKPEES